MKTALATAGVIRSAIPARSMSYPGAPQIMFAPETGSTTGGADDAAAAAAAKAEADKAEADKAAADKAAADAAAAEKAIEDARKAGGDEAAKLLREVMDKKAKLKDAEANAAALAEQLKKFEGINVDEVRELLKQKADAERAEAERKGEFDRVKAMMVEEHNKETTSIRDQLEAARKEIAKRDDTINELTVGQSFATSQFIAEDLVIPPSKARTLYAPHFERVDGVTIGYDKPAGASDRTPLVDAAGKPLAFDDAFRRIIDSDPDKERLLRSKLKPGAESSTKKPVAIAPKQNTELFGKNRIAAALNAKSS